MNPKYRSSHLVKDIPLHKESLMRLPLVEQMLSDKSLEFVKRPVDQEWAYQRVSPYSLGGFRPHKSQILIPAVSAIADWLKQPQKSARALNIGDRLVPQVIIAVHDYLHVWAYQAINQIRPNLNFGTGEITAKNFDTYVFCHLLTEAAAVVGLDYWYLSQIKLNDLVPLGTMGKPFSISYHRDEIDAELKKFAPDVQIDHRSHFARIANLYMSGEFEGFTKNSLQKSPLMLKWLKHELSYGEFQRVYTRQWLHHLSSLEMPLETINSNKPVAAGAPWQRSLIAELGNLLWRKCVDNEKIFLPKLTPARCRWYSSVDGQDLDFRFIDVNSLGMDWKNLFTRKRLAVEGLPYLFWQIVSGFRMDDFEIEEIGLIKKLKFPDDAKLLDYLLRKKPPIKVENKSVRDIFLMN